jgi:esterase/lipase superfamily enzyme
MAALKQVSLCANAGDQSETHLIAHSLGTYLMGLALRKRANIHLGRIGFAHFFVTI